jgi:hypothetical protein
VQTDLIAQEQDIFSFGSGTKPSSLPFLLLLYESCVSQRVSQNGIHCTISHIKYQPFRFFNSRFLRLVCTTRTTRSFQYIFGSVSESEFTNLMSRPTDSEDEGNVKGNTREAANADRISQGTESEDRVERTNEILRLNEE